MDTTETIIENLPILYGKTAKDQSKVWISRILSNSHGHGIYEIEHGTEGGKLQLTRRVITEGKNIGKKNETSPLDQCAAELRKKWSDKQNKEGYWVRDAVAQHTQTIGGGAAASAAPKKNTTILPMLAQSYTPGKAKKNDIVFPCYVQPKLDGLRCLVYIGEDGSIVTQSRTGGTFEHMSHIKTRIEPFLRAHPNIILDGELYTIEIPFENLAGLIKKKKVDEADLEELEKIQYHIYDFIDRENLALKFSERDQQMDAFEDELGGTAAAESGSAVRFVPTYIAKNAAEFREKFQEFIGAGYEGAMLRNSSGIYRQNYRSTDLQKYKEFQEDEFTIVDFKQGDGRDEGTVIWICETPEGRPFSVRPKGSVEFRRELYKNASKYIGEKLTVIFQELSEMGVPRFPVGKCVRQDGV